MVLPFNLEAEERVVAACLTSPRALDEISEILRPDQLHSTKLAAIYRACLDAAEAGDPVDIILLAETLDDDLTMRVRELLAAAYPAANAAHHARVVADYATRRSLIRVGMEIGRLGWDDVPDSIDRAEQLVYEIGANADSGELAHIAAGLEHTFQQLERPGGEITGTPVGIAELDKLTSGFQPGQLVVVAARPGMGKSALVINQAVHVAQTLQRPVALFTLEMSREEINQRALSQVSGVRLHSIRTRTGLDDRARRDLDTSRRILENAPLYIDDTASIRLAEIRSRVRRLKARHPDLALVAVDYLQLMLTEGNHQNRNLEIASLSRGLKVIARDLDVPVVALSQLSRAVEARADKRPMLSDLRDSGAIEQDADIVLFIYRDGYYTKEDDTQAELIVAKHRNGPLGTRAADWNPETAEFRNPPPGAH